MRTDNTHHLLAAARQRSNKARQQAEEALKQLDQTTQPATVSELARTAGVSRSWLYTQPDLLQRLQQRKQPGKAPPTGSSVRTSEASMQRRLQLAHQRIQQLTDENRRLQDRLARAHGALREARH
jgi:Mg2+ and Co2+ transporter CorA